MSPGSTNYRESGLVPCYFTGRHQLPRERFSPMPPFRTLPDTKPNGRVGVASGHSRASRLTRLCQIRTSQPRDFGIGRNIKPV